MAKSVYHVWTVFRRCWTAACPSEGCRCRPDVEVQRRKTRRCRRWHSSAACDARTWDTVDAVSTPQRCSCCPCCRDCVDARRAVGVSPADDLQPNTQLYSSENGRQTKICTKVKLNKITKHVAKVTVYGYHNDTHNCVWQTKHSKLSAVTYLFRNFKFLLWIVSSADGQLNINMYSLTISWDFILNIFLKVLCRT